VYSLCLVESFWAADSSGKHANAKKIKNNVYGFFKLFMWLRKYNYCAIIYSLSSTHL
jgi:hypothetical protein